MIALTTDLKRLGAVRAPAGFAERVLAQVGMADSYARFETVLGDVFVAWNRLGVSAAARFVSAEEFENWFGKEVGRPLMPAVAPPDLAEKIQDELNGKKRMRFDLRGLTAFEQAVLRKTREIRRPAAVRAVGTALANNPIPYFIPCHRVVRTDGHIGNYGGGGPEAKKAILTMEGVRVNRLQELASKGVRYQGVKTTKVFCYPTCHTGRHALEKNIVWLHDEASARAAGFRPCKVCRPGAQLSA